MKSYCFVGHEKLASYVARQLDGVFEEAQRIEEADIVLTYCTHASAVEDAYFDEDGIVRRARKGTLLIDLSPSTPALSRDVSAVATVNDLRPVEAPLAVLDAVATDAFGSEEGFVCYASGEDKDVNEAMPVLGKLAGLVKRTGGTGTAQLVKATHTIQACAQILSIVEADALRRAVIDGNVAMGLQEVKLEALSDVSAHTLAAIENKAFAGSYSIELMMGDIVAAMTTADDAGLILPQLESSLHLFEMLAVIGGADMSCAALSLLHSDEETCREAGLDWKRAEHLFEDEAGEHHHHVHGEYEDEDEYDGYDEQFDFGGFGVYSEN